MAWVATRETMGNNSSIDDLERTRYTRNFVVVFDDTVSSAKEAREAPGLPALYNPFEGPSQQDIDLDSIAVGIQAQQDDNPLVWRIQIQFASVKFVTQIRLAFQEDQKPGYRDFDGRSIVNSAGSLFDPPIMIPWIRGIITITKSKPTIDYFELADLADTTNEDVWLSFPIGTLKMACPQAESFFESGQFGWRVTYEIHYRKEGWLQRELDRGYRETVDPDDKSKERVIFDHATGSLPSDATLLNGKGRPLRFAKTELAEICAIDATTIEVVDVVEVTELLFADPPFQIKIDDEIMTVTAIAGTTWTVTRAQQGTEADGHTSGTKLYMEPYFLGFRIYGESVFSDIGIP